MSKTNTQMEDKNVPFMCECTCSTDCDDEGNSVDSINIGLLSTCDQSAANNFFARCREKDYPTGNFYFHSVKEFCRYCLSDFIRNYNLSVLFLVYDGDLIYEGALIRENDGIIGFIGELLDCDVTYLLRDTQ